MNDDTSKNYNDDQSPYGMEPSVPYREYSVPTNNIPPMTPPPQFINSIQPAQPLSPTPPAQPIQPVYPPQPPQFPRRTRKFPLLAAVVGIFLVAALILVGLTQVVFRSSTSTTTGQTTPVATSTSSAQTVTPTASFRAASCPFTVGTGLVEGKTIRCGYVTVPEDRQNPNGAKVQLAVAIFKSPNVQNDTAPIVRLEGGPGGPSLDDWAKYITGANLSSFVFNHDLIMFDQRGTGYSTPSLKCPELLQLQYSTLDTHLSATDSNRMYSQALQTCHDRLVKSGIDLNNFNVLENAADVHDLIVALGYKQANLYGVSYGTRLALTTMRLYPSVIRSVVLDSVYPPQVNRTELPSSTQRVFNVLFQGCAADATCAQQYPQLDSVFYQLVTTLNNSPVQFQTTDIYTGKSYTVNMAGDDFVFVLFSALYVSQFISALPQMIYQVRDHNYAILSQIYGEVEFDDTFSDGMFYSDECNEDWSFLSQNDISKSLIGIAPQIQPALKNDLEQEYDACQIWNVQKAPAVQKQPVVSSIPTLVLSDQYDPITPPSNGKETAATLQHSYYYVFPGLGHGAEYNSACVDSIVSAFDDTPTRQPSSSCIASMSEPHFT